MQHRQRKQLTSSNHTSSINSNGCELNKDVDNDDAGVESGEADAFLKGNNGGEHIKMTTFHSSPALSASALSNQTNQTNCDETSSNNKLRFNVTASNGGTPTKGHGNGDVLVHSNSAMAQLNKSPSSNKMNGGNMLNNSTTIINSKNNSIDSLNGTAGQSNGDLNQFGGSKKRVSVLDVKAFYYFILCFLYELFFYFCLPLLCKYHLSIQTTSIINMSSSAPPAFVIQSCILPSLVSSRNVFYSPI